MALTDNYPKTLIGTSTAMRPALAVFAKTLRARWIERQTRRALWNLTDRQLEDIGVARGDIALVSRDGIRSPR